MSLIKRGLCRERDPGPAIGQVTPCTCGAGLKEDGAAWGTGAGRLRPGGRHAGRRPASCPCREQSGPRDEWAAGRGVGGPRWAPRSRRELAQGARPPVRPCTWGRWEGLSSGLPVAESKPGHRARAVGSRARGRCAGPVPVYSRAARTPCAQWDREEDSQEARPPLPRTPRVAEASATPRPARPADPALSRRPCPWASSPTC